MSSKGRNVRIENQSSHSPLQTGKRHLSFMKAKDYSKLTLQTGAEVQPSLGDVGNNGTDVPSYSL